MTRRKKIHEGAIKILYEGTEPGTLIQHFKDDTPPSHLHENEVGKTPPVAGKGVLNNRISAHLMSKLEEMGIPTHFIRSVNMREQLVRAVEIIPVEVVIRNIAAGNFAKRLGLKEGTVLGRPLVEFFYKDEKLNYPLVSEEHIFTLGWANPYELEEMIAMAWRINDYLCGLFAGLELQLVDFRLEFGRLWGEHDELYIILADEISPDTCQLWDSKKKKKFNYDNKSNAPEDLMEKYQMIGQKLGLIPEGGIIKGGSINKKIAENLDQIENEFARKRRLKELNKGPKTTRK